MMVFREALRIHLAALAAGRSDFEDTLALVERYFEYVPTAFDNGQITNAVGQNEGACRIFALAESAGLAEHATLSCFGRHYRAVIDHPGGNSHINIRQFISTGWSGIHFHGQPLRLRSRQTGSPEDDVANDHALASTNPLTQPDPLLNHGDAS